MQKPSAFAAACVLAGMPALAQAQVVVISTFDTSVEDWQVVEMVYDHFSVPPNTVPATHDANFGNPAGSLRTMDTFGNTGVLAPAPYLGDKSAFYGGFIEYDLLIRFTDNVLYHEAVLRSDTQSLFYLPDTLPPLGSLTRRRVPLTEAGWRSGGVAGPPATAAEMQQVLGSLGGVSLLIEWGTGPDDTTIDNVVMQSPDLGPALSIADLRIAEGDDGTRTARFRVTLAPASGAEVSVKAATADGTALAGSDYQSKRATLRFAPGETQKLVKVKVAGDLETEADETFRVDLSRPMGAVIVDGQAQGTIVNDD